MSMVSNVTYLHTQQSLKDIFGTAELSCTY